MSFKKFHFLSFFLFYCDECNFNWSNSLMADHKQGSTDLICERYRLNRCGEQYNVKCENLLLWNKWRSTSVLDFWSSLQLWWVTHLWSRQLWWRGGGLHQWEAEGRTWSANSGLKKETTQTNFTWFTAEQITEKKLILILANVANVINIIKVS